MSEEAPILRTKAAARYLGCSHQWLIKARARGDGPPYLRLGNTIVAYRREDLDRYLEKRVIPMFQGHVEGADGTLYRRGDIASFHQEPGKPAEATLIMNRGRVVLAGRTWEEALRP